MSVSLEKSRRKVFAALLTALGIWALYVPEQQRIAFSALPSDALALSWHQDLAETYRDTLRIPTIAAIFDAFGLDANALADDMGTWWLFRLTTGKTAVFAFDECAGSSGEPVLYGASYCGARGPILRAMLFVRWIPGLGRLRKSKEGVCYLPLDKNDKKEGLKVSFAIHDNVLLASLSSDPATLIELDRRAKFLPEPMESLGADYRQLAPTVRHRIWFNPVRTRTFAMQHGVDIPSFDYARLDVEKITRQEISLVLDVDSASCAGLARYGKISGNIASASSIPSKDMTALALVAPKFAEHLAADFGLPYRCNAAAGDCALVIGAGNHAMPLKFLGMKYPLFSLTAFLPGQISMDEIRRKFSKTLVSSDDRDTCSFALLPRGATKAFRNQAMLRVESFEEQVIATTSMARLGDLRKTNAEAIRCTWREELAKIIANRRTLLFCAFDLRLLGAELAKAATCARLAVSVDPRLGDQGAISTLASLSNLLEAQSVKGDAFFSLSQAGIRRTQIRLQTKVNQEQ